MEHLTKPQLMLLPGQCQAAADENHDTSAGGGGLRVDGADMVLALIEGQLHELLGDGMCSQNLLPFECQHRGRLVERRESGSICVKELVVVIHKRSPHQFNLF